MPHRLLALRQPSLQVADPVTQTAARVFVGFIRKTRHCGEPQHFVPNGDQVKGPHQATFYAAHEVFGTRFDTKAYI
jgi:hypothetical protein